MNTHVSPFSAFRQDFNVPFLARSPHLLAPDAVRPQQMIPDRCESGESKLWRACLQDAFLCLAGRVTSGSQRAAVWREHVAEETWAWFCDSSEEPGSFLFCCAAIGADPQRLRKRAAGIEAARAEKVQAVVARKWAA